MGVNLPEETAIEAVHTARVRSYLASFSTGEPLSVSANVTDDFVNKHLGVLGGGCEGKIAYEARLENFLTSFAQLRYDALAVVTDAQTGSARYDMHFRQNGTDFTVPGIMWFDFKDGLIARRIDCWDGLTYLRQAKADANAIAAML
ncbi:MAG: nuclear transport factor 2 family protein [Pseudomonadota bacterium]